MKFVISDSSPDFIVSLRENCLTDKSVDVLINGIPFIQLWVAKTKENSVPCVGIYTTSEVRSLGFEKTEPFGTTKVY